jgi:pimeloyl-ACP methyl ester carboxylesterase
MAAFVLVPGAGGEAAGWAPVGQELTARGHEVIAVDIAEDDPALGLPEYAELVLAAVGDRRSVVLVGQSMGAFTVAMVAEQVAPLTIVLLNAMIPLPGETPGQWWGNTGSEAARIAAAEAGGYPTAFEVGTYFLHDVPQDVLASGPQGREPADTPFGQPCTFRSWPDVPLHVITAEGDRFFPRAFQQRVARERLGVVPDVVPGGHLATLSHPVPIAELLCRYVAAGAA